MLKKYLSTSSQLSNSCPSTSIIPLTLSLALLAISYFLLPFLFAALAYNIFSFLISSLYYYYNLCDLCCQYFLRKFFIYFCISKIYFYYLQNIYRLRFLKVYRAKALFFGATPPPTLFRDTPTPLLFHLNLRRRS